MNWDNLKYFLAVAQFGSIRAAAKKLNVDPATVSRRIRQFEDSLGKRLFERSRNGYDTTKLGNEIFEEASNLEEWVNAISRRLVANDKELTGEIRITLHEGLLQPFLMENLAEFSRQHPKIELEILDSDKILNLSKREADLALRFCRQPAEHLIGKKVAQIHRACYYAKHLIDDVKHPEWPNKTSWICWNDKLRRPIGKIAREYPRFNSKHKIFNINLQASACRAGMGVAILPCFIGDSDPTLSRIPPYTSEYKYDLWLLYHPDLRDNSKIQAITQFLYQCFEKHQALFEGKNFVLPNTVNSI